jgi:predicted metalloprotease with PDZ domain
VSGAQLALTFTMTVYALDQSVRGSYLDRQRGYFNGPCVFALPAGRSRSLSRSSSSRRRTRRAQIGAWPRRSRRRTWTSAVSARTAPLTTTSCSTIPWRSATSKASTSRPPASASSRHRGPVRIRSRKDRDGSRADLRGANRVLRRARAVRSLPILGLAVGEGYGGLEHRASTSLIFGRDDLPKAGEAGPSREYQRFLALASHEYFHAWHVKRTKPAAFMPYRLDRRNHTRQLWIFEGITSYYQDLMLRKSGVIGVNAYLQRLGEILTRVYRMPGRFKQSLEASSFDAWDVLYRPEPHHPNTTISYYTKARSLRSRSI